MAIIGIQINKENPAYSIADFTFWMPQFKNFMQTDEGATMFDNLYPIADAKIFYSIYGSDWKLAMSYCIAHYATLIGQQQQAPSGDTLSSVAGGGVTRGVLQSMTVGGFTKSYDIDKTMSSEEEAMFWNQTSYGAALWALLKTKNIPSIFVVTSHPVPGAN